MRHLALRDRTARQAAMPSPAVSMPFIESSAARTPRISALSWKPSTEIDVDVDNALEYAAADQSAPAGDNAAPPCGACWRQRNATTDDSQTHQHAELPLAGDDPGAVLHATEPEPSTVPGNRAHAHLSRRFAATVAHRAMTTG